MASEAVYYALITGLPWLSTTGIKRKAIGSVIPTIRVQIWAVLSSNEYSGTTRFSASFIVYVLHYHTVGIFKSRCDDPNSKNVSQQRVIF